MPSRPVGASVELRYLSGSATHPAVDGVHRLALEEFTANAQFPSWRGAGRPGQRRPTAARAGFFAFFAIFRRNA